MNANIYLHLVILFGFYQNLCNNVFYRVNVSAVVVGRNSKVITRQTARNRCDAIFV